MTRPKPGTFRRLTYGEKPLNSDPVSTEPMRAETISTLVGVYRRFVEKFDMPSNVLYVGCGYDGSPSEVFQNVTYIDDNQHPINILSAAGLDARCRDAHIFVPDREIDLLLVMRFSLTPQDFRRILPRGRVLCDYYQGRQAYSNPDFGFVMDMERPDKRFDRNGKGYYLFERR